MYRKELISPNVLNSFETGISKSGTMFVTELVAILPNALAAPLQRYHDVEVGKQIVTSAMEQQTSERATICDTIVELAKAGELDSERFQMLMIAYGMKRF